MNSSYKNIFKATTLFGGVQGLNIVINLVRTKLVALFLGPEGIGLSAIYNESRELIHETTNCGLDQSGIREISIGYEEYLQTGDRERMDNAIKLTRSLVAVFALIGTLACFVFALPLSLFTFSDSSHTVGYMVLAPSIGLSTLVCGEMTVLKATRRLKSIALFSTLNILFGMCVSVPLYYLYGMSGVLPAILLLLCVQLAIVCWFSFRSAPPRYDFQTVYLKTGKPMLFLGGAFVIQGLIAHSAKLGVQSFINTHGSLADVGLFNATTLVITTYLGIFASSIAADFYPRLSGIYSDERKRNLAVRRQIDVIQMLTAPMLVAFIVIVDVIVPLLLSERFIAIVPVLEIALVTSLTRSISQPMAYLPLAAGDSRRYILLDLIDYAILFIVYTSCYKVWGVMGLGYGIFLYNLLECLWVNIYARFLYNVTPNRRNIIFWVLQTALLAVAYLTASHFAGSVMRWALGGAVVAVSAVCSCVMLRIINRETE